MYNEPQLLIVCRGIGGTGDIKISPPKCSITNLSIVISVDKEIDKNISTGLEKCRYLFT